MDGPPSNCSGLRLIAVALTLALCACQTHGDRTAALGGFNAPADALMLVIDDPRSERRRRGITTPGYNTQLAYADDPALERAAKAIAADHALEVLQQWPLRNLAVHCLVIERPSAATLKALRGDPRIKWVQPFNSFDTQAGALAGGIIATEDAKGVDENSFMSRVLRDFSEQGAGVRIAVIDTSIDAAHPDLTNSPVRQINFAGDRGQHKKEAHGTAVVGLISASSESPKGVNGFAQQANVEVLRACWQVDAKQKGKCNTLTLALALDHAIDLRPQVVNLSLTGRSDRVLEELLSVLLERGSIVIAAWDEQREPSRRFPRNRPGVVYAYGAHAAPAPSLDYVLSAPRHALSLAPMAGYDLVSGHSIAAPQISALAARLIDRAPDASRSEILAQLKMWLNENQIAH